MNARDVELSGDRGDVSFVVLEENRELAPLLEASFVVLERRRKIFQSNCAAVCKGESVTDGDTEFVEVARP